MAGHKGKGPLRIAIEDFLETFGWWDKIRQWVYDRVEGIEDAVTKAHTSEVEEAAQILEEQGDVGRSLAAILRGEHQGGVTAILGFGAQLGMSAATGLLAPLMRLLNYRIDRTTQTGRADPSAWFALIRRHPQLAEALPDNLRDLGWSDEYIEAWDEATKPTLPEGELLTLYYRREIPEDELRRELQARGWTDERIDRMIARFEYDADFPAQVVEWAEKQGLSEEWVKYFWRSHWELPSISAGYEMLHRLRPGVTDVPFTREDLETLLRTADIPRFFRERLIEISYSPYTRVDVRRMYQMGVLSEEDVYNNYLDLGYDEEHARNLTQFTILDATEEDRSLTRTLITGAYKRSVFSRDEAKGALQQIGYPETYAEIILQQVDYDIAKDRVDDEIDRVRYMYVEGEYQEGDVYAELGPLNLPSTQVADLIHKWDVERLKKRVLPTKADLEEWYKRDLITADELLAGLQKRRIYPEDAELYLRSIDIEVAEAQAKELERAQKEQERLRLADLASEYQRRKAELDVEISQAKLAIADLKLSLHTIEDPKQISDVKREMQEIKQAEVIRKARELALERESRTESPPQGETAPPTRPGGQSPGETAPSET